MLPCPDTKSRLCIMSGSLRSSGWQEESTKKLATNTNWYHVACTGTSVHMRERERESSIHSQTARLWWNTQEARNGGKMKHFFISLLSLSPSSTNFFYNFLWREKRKALGKSEGTKVERERERWKLFFEPHCSHRELQFCLWKGSVFDWALPLALGSKAWARLFLSFEYEVVSTSCRDVCLWCRATLKCFLNFLHPDLAKSAAIGKLKIY